MMHQKYNNVIASRKAAWRSRRTSHGLLRRLRLLARLGGRPPDGIDVPNWGAVFSEQPAEETVQMNAITIGLDLAKSV
ncbi:MAG TPA: hypothetical protein VLR47_05685, partial [Rhodospirillales bacterium]|nr:hypothetical protein [Rhodospirillales bacterium]